MNISAIHEMNIVNTSEINALDIGKMNIPSFGSFPSNPTYLT